MWPWLPRVGFRIQNPGNLGKEPMWLRRNSKRKPKAEVCRKGTSSTASCEGFGSGQGEGEGFQKPKLSVTLSSVFEAIGSKTFGGEVSG